MFARPQFIPRGTSKKSWTSSEDAQLLELIEEYGASSWTVIAEKLVNRTGKQCRERYHNHLNPEVKKGDWSEREDQILAELHEKLGNQWAKIAKSLPGRTDNSIKNRWHTAHRPMLEESGEIAANVSSNNHSRKSLSNTAHHKAATTKHSLELIPSLDLSDVNAMDSFGFAYCHDHCYHSHEATYTSRSEDSAETVSWSKQDKLKASSKQHHHAQQQQNQPSLLQQQQQQLQQHRAIFGFSARLLENGSAPSPSPCLQYWIASCKTTANSNSKQGLGNGKNVNLSDLICTESCFGDETARSLLLLSARSEASGTTDCESASATSSSGSGASSGRKADASAPMEYSFPQTLRLEIDVDDDCSPLSTQTDTFFAATHAAGDEEDDDEDDEQQPASRRKMKCKTMLRANGVAVKSGSASADLPSMINTREQKRRKRL